MQIGSKRNFYCFWYITYPRTNVVVSVISITSFEFPSLARSLSSASGVVAIRISYSDMIRNATEFCVATPIQRYRFEKSQYEYNFYKLAKEICMSVSFQVRVNKIKRTLTIECK